MMTHADSNTELRAVVERMGEFLGAAHGQVAAGARGCVAELISWDNILPARRLLHFT